jgi:hypothetical protein
VTVLLPEEPADDPLDPLDPHAVSAATATAETPAASMRRRDDLFIAPLY